MMTHRGFWVKNRKGMGHWDALLEEWLVAVERYCRIFDGSDAPFIYTERANVGLLAGAAWRSGRIALEEFQYEKGFKYKSKWNGRADLYMASEDQQELVEAKFRWLSLSANKMEEIASNTLDDAVVDARICNGGREDIRCIGVAFLPMYSKKKYADILEARIGEAVNRIGTLNVHAMAWCFPKEVRTLEGLHSNLLPGVIMIARNASIA
jgi:hypothetical protein